MADLEKQNRDEILKNVINDVVNNVGTQNINKETQEDIKELNPDSVVENKLPTSELRSFVRSLPENEKDNVLRYLDVFRNNNAPVVSYIEDIKKYGSVKKAKEAGATSGLLNPNKFLKDFSKEGDEEDLKRFTSNLILGNEIYDVSKRDDFVGQQKQKEYLNKKTTKTMRGVGMAMEESARETFRTVAALSDAGFNTEMLDFLEQNWPEVEKSRQGVEQLAEDLTQFGISIFAGKKILNGFGKIARLTGNKFDSTRKILDRFDKALKKGKVVKDKSGNIKLRSSIAQKLGYWGVGGAVAYGIGEVVTGGSEDDKTILGDVKPFGIGTEKLELKDTEGLTGRAKATQILANKLKYGADGTALVGGLTVAGKTIAMPVLRAGNKYLLAPGFRKVGSGLDILSKVAASEKTGIPQLTRKIIESKNKVLTKAGIPKMEDWQFFSMTAGPLKERIMKAADKFILTPIRTRGPLTQEAKDLLIKSEGLVNKYRKRVDMKMKQLENKIYTLTEKSLVDKIITDATPVAAKGYLDDIVLFLQNKIGINDLPQVLRNSSKEVKTVIDDLTKELQPYIKSGQLEKEFIDNIGKYLRNSYEIFRRNSFKPNSSQIKSATDYFKEQIKRMDPEYKNVKIGSGTDLDNQLSRLASSKVDEILNVGQEGSSPKERIKAITSVVAPFLDKKNSFLPKVVENLLGKVNDPRAIVLDTVTQQANLLAHIRYHKALVRNGLKNNWIFRDEKDFIRIGFQKEVAPSLVPITVSKNRMNVDLTDVYSYKIGKARAPYYTTKEIAQAINGDNLVTDFLLKMPVYKMYLAAKTTSQLSKTVLSLMTQMRNVETAAFFSFINGHMGRNASVIDSMKIAFQDVIGKGNVKPEVMKKKLEEYLQYGVFDNSVVAAEVEAVLKDLVKGKYTSSEQFLKYLLNNPVFRKATEFYQASDNLWKAYGYEFTKSQMVPAIPIKGLSLDDAAKLGYKIEPGRKTAYTWQDLVIQQYKEIFNMKWDPLDFTGNPKTYSQALRDIAAKYTRDVYPNYSMVPQIVKEWRRLPVGNFVAFRSEIIRNIYNILTYSTREISSSNPYIRQIGARRLMGFGSVMYGFDKGLEGISSSLTGLDEEFIKGYQRFFSPWYAKNDKIIPVSKPDKDGKFQSIDWSKEQPFASITDGFNTFTEGMFNPDKSDEAMFTRFFKSMFYDYEEKKNGALTQIFEPFITESILTEAILDVSPKWMFIPGARGGETKEGKRIYDAANEPYDVVVGKIFNHLIQTINPTTFVSAGKVLSAYDEEVNTAGDKYNTTNELLKMFLGIGITEQNPKTSMTYIISDFSDRLQAADRTFKKSTYDLNQIFKDPTNILEQWDLLQRNRYREMSRVSDFLKVAERLFPKGEIALQFKDRQNFGKKTMQYLFANRYRPSNIPGFKEYTDITQKSYRKLLETYPDLKFEDVFPLAQMQEIVGKWNGVPLGLSDEDLERYFNKELPSVIDKQSQKPDETIQQEPQQVSQKPQTPPLPDTPMPNQQVIQTAMMPASGVMNQGLTATENALLSEEEKQIRLRQRGLA
jgi:hypothetical protein